MIYRAQGVLYGKRVREIRVFVCALVRDRPEMGSLLVHGTDRGRPQKQCLPVRDPEFVGEDDPGLEYGMVFASLPQ